MRIAVDVGRCVGAGVCVMAAPDVFDQNDDDGVVIVLDDQPAADQHTAVRDAATRCPAAVIHLHEA